MTRVFLYEPFYDFDRLVDEIFLTCQAQKTGKRDAPVGAVKPLKPRMDLHEDDKTNVVTVTFEFPGVSKEDVQLDFHNGKLTISAETKRSNEQNKDGYAILERRYGKFERALQLPEGVKDDEIKASMENGVLTITFPKSAPNLAPRKVTIS